MIFNSDLFPVLVFIAILVLYNLYLWNTAKNIIRKCLKEKGMMNINIARNFFALGGTLKFDVTYTMPNGIRYQNSCTMYIWWFFLDNEIVWRDPL